MACNAGELVEQTSDLTGATWTTSVLYLKSGSGCGASTIRRNSEYHHFDLQGYLSLVSGASASTLAARIYNRFGVQQFASGSAQTPWISNNAYIGADGLLISSQVILSARNVGTAIRQAPQDPQGPTPDCKAIYGPFAGYKYPCQPDNYQACVEDCKRLGQGVIICCQTKPVTAPRLGFHCTCDPIKEPKPQPVPPKPVGGWQSSF